MNSPAKTGVTQAQARCAELLSMAPHDQPLTMAMEQLDFILATLLGQAHDPLALRRINLGLLAAKEFESRAPDFADMLYAVEDVVAGLRQQQG
jgi:Tsi6